MKYHITALNKCHVIIFVRRTNIFRILFFLFSWSPIAEDHDLHAFTPNSFVNKASQLLAVLRCLESWRHRRRPRRLGNLVTKTLRWSSPVFSWILIWQYRMRATCLKILRTHCRQTDDSLLWGLIWLSVVYLLKKFVKSKLIV